MDSFLIPTTKQDETGGPEDITELGESIQSHEKACSKSRLYLQITICPEGLRM